MNYFPTFFSTVQKLICYVTVFYGGYAKLKSLDYTSGQPAIDGDTEISRSEWSIIKPLFMLYLDKEHAIALEASRVRGVDVYGRSVSEIEQAIGQYEAELPMKAFTADIVSI